MPRSSCSSTWQWYMKRPTISGSVKAMRKTTHLTGHQGNSIDGTVEGLRLAVYLHYLKVHPMDVEDMQFIGVVPNRPLLDVAERHTRIDASGSNMLPLIVYRLRPPAKMTVRSASIWAPVWSLAGAGLS